MTNKAKIEKIKDGAIFRLTYDNTTKLHYKYESTSYGENNEYSVQSFLAKHETGLYFESQCNIKEFKPTYVRVYNVCMGVLHYFNIKYTSIEFINE